MKKLTIIGLAVLAILGAIIATVAINRHDPLTMLVGMCLAMTASALAAFITVDSEKPKPQNPKPVRGPYK